jgi:EpsI family protein
MLTYFIAWKLKPTIKLADIPPTINLIQDTPKKFNNWTLINTPNNVIVNPEQQTVINNIYSQTLSRTYKNHQNGSIIMLSIAYGEEQNDNKAVHFPEVCYPAQGLQISKKMNAVIKTPFKSINVNQLIANGNSRVEPITYWITIGQYQILNSKQAKFKQLAYGLKGQIPDGVLVRVSSIDQNIEKAYAEQQLFINDFLESLAPKVRDKLIGY